MNRHELGFLNALLRKLPEAILSIDPNESLADFYSHPHWLVAHWLDSFGPDQTHALLEWNQQIPGHSVRLYQTGGELPAFLQPTEWDGFYKISGAANWQEQVAPLLQSGKAYIKDPSTRFAPALLAPEPGMQVLDLCAAPGGKSFDLADLMGFTGHIVAVDVPGDRIQRLRDNLARLAGLGVITTILEADVLRLNAATLEQQGLPPRYDAVMLDAPCSNTGVIQRRTDVKWRLEPKDIPECAALQLRLLSAASQFVKPGGRLVYSTCSLETAENRSVVDQFLQSSQGTGFELLREAVSLPWITGHDGAGAFLLYRKA